MISFAACKENADLIHTLIRQVNSGKLHHAHLFIGKMGYGCLPLIFAFIKYVYCKDRQATDACHVCSSCIKIDKMAHVDTHCTFPTFDKDNLSDELLPDFRELYEETQGYFDLKTWMDYHKKYNVKIREKECDIIINNMLMTSYEGGYKSQIIWMIEYMGAESNKLLKILEEPPAQSLFILMAESSDRILPTILSRCNVHRLQPLGADTIRQHLMQHNGQINAELKEQAVLFSEGDIIAAQRYSEDFDSDFSLEEHLVLFMRGLIKFEERKFSNIQFFLELADKLTLQNKAVQIKFLEFVLYFVQELTRYQVVNTPHSNESIGKIITHMAPLIEIDQIEAWRAELEHAIYALQGNANIKITFVSLGIELGRIMNREEFIQKQMTSSK